jgi:hypothetical protein
MNKVQRTHEALDMLLTLAQSENDAIFDISVTTMKFDEDLASGELIQETKTEFIAEIIGTTLQEYEIESMMKRIEIEYYGTEVKESHIDLEPTHADVYHLALTGVELITAWALDQVDIDGDTVQVDEIMNEWHEMLHTKLEQRIHDNTQRKLNGS